MNDGGPAFPTSTETFGKVVTDKSGMTLRDYFAAKALQGLWACDHGESYPGDVNAPDAERYIADWRKTAYAGEARSCYAIADAMLKARDSK